MLQELSIKLLHNHKSIMSHADDYYTGFSFGNSPPNSLGRFVGPVKGLICINPNNPELRTVVCNPFLGQLEILPHLTYLHPDPCQIWWHDVALGFHEDYKVVQLLFCKRHQCVHAQLYSRKTNSWTEFTADRLRVLDGLHHIPCIPIISRCKNGYFSHWFVHRYNDGGAIVLAPEILTLDMRNEVFRTVCLPASPVGMGSIIFAENEHSFRRFDFPSVDGSVITVGINESICEGNVLRWNHVMNVEVPFSDYKMPLWQPGWVFFYQTTGGALVYDSRARKFICKHAMLPEGSRIVEYKGSFVSPKN